MKKTTNLRAFLSVFNYNRNIFLAILLLVLISFTGGKIIKAAGVAPDPGHLVTEIGDLDEYYDTRYDTRLSTKTSDDVTEGATNLYFSGKTTDQLNEGATNKYYSETLFDASLAAKNTDDVDEGISNLYFTDARVTAPARVAISATGPVSYNNGTGVISLGTVGVANGGTGAITANAGFNALAPSQTGQSNKFLQTDGTNTSWTTVDKTFVGLSNVENTALSTWAGSSNIVNLGTIATGAWQATPIVDTYIASSAVWNAKETALVAGTAAQYYRGDKNWATLDTSVVPENGNLYYTTARANTDFDAQLLTKTTNNLNEGATNLYYTDARADARITAAAGTSIAELVAGKIPTSRLPALAITDTFVVGGEAAMTALTAETGDVAVRTDLNKSFILTTNDPTNPINWQELLTPTDTVLSVNGQTGAVSLSTTDIPEGTNEYYTNAKADARITNAKADPNGVASLVTGKLPTAQLPGLLLSNIYSVADILARDALIAVEGDLALVRDNGAAQVQLYYYTGGAWQ